MSTHPSVEFTNTYFQVHTGTVFGEGEDDWETIHQWESETQPIIDEVGQALVPLMNDAADKGLIQALTEGFMYQWDGKKPLVPPMRYTFEVRFFKSRDFVYTTRGWVTIAIRTADAPAILKLVESVTLLLSDKK